MELRDERIQTLEASKREVLEEEKNVHLLRKEVDTVIAQREELKKRIPQLESAFKTAEAEMKASKRRLADVQKELAPLESVEAACKDVLDQARKKDDDARRRRDGRARICKTQRMERRSTRRMSSGRRAR